MRRSPVPKAVATALTTLLLLPAAALGQSVAPEAAEPTGAEATGTTPPPAATQAPPPATSQPRQRTVRRQLAALRDSALITPEAHDVAAARYTAARGASTRLTGRRRVELSAVLTTVEAVARRGELTASRVPLAFETLERNRQWWTTGALLAYGARTTFAGSELVWQSYPGQGIQVQWLGTFGRANGLFSGGKRYDGRLRTLVDEALALAAGRAGGLAFESWFTFDGGRPPWVSALSQGTALQAISRAGSRLVEPRYLEAARSSLGIFRTAPPEGVRITTPAGAHYLQYSFAPKLRIVNGFVQALNGLHDFGELADDATGRALFAAGDAQLRTELPRADTGAWSRYAVGGNESDLGYHRLLRDFLRGLCQRSGEGLYCDTAARFTADLTRPPALRLLAPATPARQGKSTRVAFTLDKVSSVTLVVTRAGSPVFSRTARVPRGRSAFSLPRLRKAGALELRLRATDLAGNATSATGRLEVAAAPKRPRTAPKARPAPKS